MEMIAYLRVSTPSQAATGFGLAAQRAAIQNYAYPRGWQLSWISDAGRSAATLQRPGITDALTLLETRQADGLIVARLDRLSRSLRDFTQLIELSKRQHWTLVCIDPGLDLSTPTGELAATILAAVAQWERRSIVERSREGYAAALAQGRIFGHRRPLLLQTMQRIHTETAAGVSANRIADGLNADHVPTASGHGSWTPQQARVVASRPIEPCTEPPAPTLPQTDAEKITRRERQILELIQQGKSTERIALTLHISPRTVHWHVHHLKQKLDIHTRHARRELQQINLS